MSATTKRQSGQNKRPTGKDRQRLCLLADNLGSHLAEQTGFENNLSCKPQVVRLNNAAMIKKNGESARTHAFTA